MFFFFSFLHLTAKCYTYITTLDLGLFVPFTSQSSMLKIVYINKVQHIWLYDMHDMETYQNVQFMEYEAYHCLDLIAPQIDVLS